jgi:PAS domain S-box-containing protein
VAKVWKLLTEPSRAIPEGLERRQARVLSTALLILLPLWVVTVVTTIVTRARGVTAGEIGLAVAINSLAFGSYVLSRTRYFRVAVTMLIVASLVGSMGASIVEPIPERAVVSLLYASTGALYAAILLNTKATLVSAIMALLSSFIVATNHQSLGKSSFVLPIFLLAFILGLTVVVAAVREGQLKTIEAQSARLAATLQSAMDAVVVVDRRGFVTGWSPRAESLFSVSTPDALGAPLAHLVVGPNESQRIDDALKEAKGRRLEFETLRNERRASFEASVAPLIDGSGAVVVLRDVTERKQMEARLAMSDRLEAMGRLVAGVAHEINNPLAYVQANLRAIEEEFERTTLSDAERRELVGVTIDGAKRIQTIVKDLLTFARNTGENEVVPVDVERALGSALHIAQAHIAMAKAQVIRQFAGVGEVMAIESRLGQVFLTLLTNAVQALPTEGGRREILVSTRRTEQEIVVGVRDFGEGMTAQTRAKLFTPFFTTKPVGKGTGLGLSIAQSLITALGGEIRVESAPGQGALFEVVLPITPTNATKVSA